eukprot:SAG22_NODE_288_length_12949_cov_163.316265_2_plen_44_part_00
MALPQFKRDPGFIDVRQVRPPKRVPSPTLREARLEKDRHLQTI